MIHHPATGVPHVFKFISGIDPTDPGARHGILVWEETVAWQPSLEDLMDETFMALQALAGLERLDFFRLW